MMMGQIAQQCKCLKQIVFYRMEGITDISIAAIAQHCRQLEELRLEDCLAISDISLQAIAENCRNLTYLRLADMNGIRKPSLILDIARNNKRLKFGRIEIYRYDSDCMQIAVQRELWAITSGR